VRAGKGIRGLEGRCGILAGMSKSEAGKPGQVHQIKMSILQDIECRIMFHNSRFEYMIIYTIHEATGPHRL